MVETCGPPRPGNIDVLKQEPTYIAAQRFENMDDCRDAAVYVTGRLLEYYSHVHPPIQVAWHCKELQET
jgi:hypothetical protein